MSSGPEHYREAERLTKIAVESMNKLAESLKAGVTGIESREYANTLASIRETTALAQVHATLAQAAATALAAHEDARISVPRKPSDELPASFASWIMATRSTQ
ncbi:hypothetical protein SEA_LILBEANIE_60 [Gordonia phage Lilbeanie]|uniref:Uncharacterized protein n=1 Tax=Gordonia phage Lilbeanie TaxID=2794947 RepID=A0A7T1KSC3_9CAUD|nr:hypothetical protein J1773_gp60 [Gordonia phage Lilbeanie]QPO17138.1 hypothetical protein SEA_LILBEANIE_60 [Gordonia phage Lilbeanie]